MKEEFTELGRQLKELAEKYGYKYITLSYVDGSVIGNTSRDEENFVDIYMFNEILEKEESEQ